MNKMGSYITIVCVMALLGQGFCQNGPIVNTIYGSVEGLTEEFEGQTYESFLGIPFAAPPVGDLRWEKPLPPQSWDGVRQATKVGPPCHQLGVLGNEDCLLLHVWVPHGVNALNDSLPVMFWVHGGAFILGSGRAYKGYDLALQGPVIVVTANHRLGLLGFMSTNDKYVAGNYGLWDITAALKWVNQNIANFGGNPDQVTVFGQSAGAAIVSHLVLSNHSNTYFKRAIEMSGSANSYFGISSLHKQVSQWVAVSTGCDIFMSSRLVQCLRKKNPNLLDILSLAVPTVIQGHLPSVNPRVDGDFVPDHPRSLMEAGLNTDHDILTGATLHDGGLFVSPGSFLNFASSVPLLESVIRLLLNVYRNVDDIMEMLPTIYPDIWSEDLETRTKEAVRLASECLFLSPSHFEAETHSRTVAAEGTGKRTYRYVFRYHSDIFPSAFDWMEGVHCEDLAFVFGQDLLHFLWPNRNFSEADSKLRDEITGYYINFVYTGNPNEGPHNVSVFWPEYDDTKHQILEQKPNMEVVTEDPQTMDRLQFWNDLFANGVIPKGQSDFDVSDISESQLSEVFTTAEEVMREMEKEKGFHIGIFIAKAFEKMANRQ